ncbi:uncharacterized transcriptional regulatory protein C11D3.07c [Aspergillus udagawae]|uniref:Uncharacterized transcriptional regulatory protein C11D3.07c n=1 Tax=Aspergillus udagawae TaxID=91492 RepID=A0A8H3SEM4_9EURO|nr:uncharacterized transcriptional regulatory protein C11D3.07c [Aspergillus udagawae]
MPFSNPGSLDTFRSRSSEAERNIEDRLQRLEQTVRSLSSSIDQVLQTLSAASSSRDETRGPDPNNCPMAIGNNRPTAQLYIGPSHSFSFLEETASSMKTIRRPPHDTTLQNAISELGHLSSRLTTAHVENSTEGLSTFYVPSRAAGYGLISKFLECAELGEPFFRLPPDDILKQVVFEPQNVREKAWVVYFNYLLLAAVSAENYEDEEKFRHNTHLALKDSSIFLVPHVSHVQVLALLAIHGEDFAAPNISWMLLGHACRQAEALGLHMSTRKATPELSQHRLCLFWMLFILDRSCALAFGRPAFLSISLYRHVPLPDDQFMLKFQPHYAAEHRNRQHHPQVNSFGVLVFKRSVELAKLTGYVLEILATGKSSITKSDIQSKLNAWFLQTNKVLSESISIESTSANARQIREMNLGINSMRFQYLHILVLLLKEDGQSSDTLLACAREAISLLPSLVSNWGSVYNGLVWQLLYYAFTPFFVIFENVVHPDSQGPTVEQDLGLLATTVTYFTDMRAQMRLLARVCSRLQHTAAVFLQLAQAHVRHKISTKPGSKATCSSKRANSSGLDGPATQACEGSTDAGLGQLDITSYLEWLPGDMDATCRMLEVEMQDATDQHSGLGEGSNLTEFPIRRPTSDRVFDWFSWDVYYADIDS